MTSNSKLTNEGLTFSGQFPVMLQQLDHPPSVDERLSFDARNLALLKTFSTPDYFHREIDSELEGLKVEIQGLNSKLNLIQELLTQLLMKHETLPSSSLIKLGISKLIIVNKNEWEVFADDNVVADLYLFEDLPRPLTVFGKVKSLSILEDFRHSAEINLDPLSEGVDSLLGRFIFRQHRREVAMKRAQIVDP